MVAGGRGRVRRLPGLFWLDLAVAFAGTPVGDRQVHRPPLEADHGVGDRPDLGMESPAVVPRHAVENRYSAHGPPRIASPVVRGWWTAKGTVICKV